MKIHYIEDINVGPLVDLELRYLLSACFKDAGPVFSKQRFYKEKPFHRFYICDSSDNIVAHVAVHDKTVITEEREYTIAGIAEVCVHPDHRGKGYVRMILSEVHDFMSKRNIDFAVLFGDETVYHSSGYRCVNNLLMKLSKDKEWHAVDAMAMSLSTQWPETDVKLSGPTF